MKSPRATLAGLYQKYGEERVNLFMEEEFVSDVAKFMDDLKARKFIRPLADKDVHERFRALAKKWRLLAQVLGWNGPVAYLMKAGFHFKQGPKFGTCYQDSQDLQTWKLKEGDEPTPSALVFWVPRLVAESMSKNVQEQKDLLVQVRTKLELPEHHLSGFGSVSILMLLIQSHFRRTEEQVPSCNLWIRTDSLFVGGNRLSLRWRDGILDCGDWYWVEYGNEFLGCFPLGVETLEN